MTLLEFLNEQSGIRILLYGIVFCVTAYFVMQGLVLIFQAMFRRRIYYQKNKTRSDLLKLTEKYIEKQFKSRMSYNGKTDKTMTNMDLVNAGYSNALSEVVDDLNTIVSGKGE
jgi:hypothetical protein